MEIDFLQEAIIEARKAYEKDEIPVGAVIVKDKEIIARAHNVKEKNQDCTAHAEIIAIKRASKILNNWRLLGCEMYVTLEPCPMCAAAIAAARIRRVHIGTFDETTGACGSVINIVQNESLNNNVDVKWLYSEECSTIMTGFFGLRRKEV